MGLINAVPDAQVNMGYDKAVNWSSSVPVTYGESLFNVTGTEVQD